MNKLEAIIGNLVHYEQNIWHVKSTHKNFIKSGTIVKVETKKSFSYGLTYHTFLESLFPHTIYDSSEYIEQEKEFPELEIFQNNIFHCFQCTIESPVRLHQSVYLCTPEEALYILSHPQLIKNITHDERAQKSLTAAYEKYAQFFYEIEILNEILLNLYKTCNLPYQYVQNIARICKK